jgi:hypothetical protein
MSQFCSILDNLIGLATAKFRVQGPKVTSSLCATAFWFVNAKTVLSQTFRDQDDQRKAYFGAYQIALRLINSKVRPRISYPMNNGKP